MATAKISLEQLIDALIEGKKALAALSDAEQSLAAMTQQKVGLTAQIEILHKESDNLATAVKDHKRSIDEHVAREKANADQEVTAYRASKESEKQQIASDVATAKRDSESAIAGYQAQESTAKQSCAAAKAELAAINEALDKSRNELSKVAKYMPMARA